MAIGFGARSALFSGFAGAAGAGAFTLLCGKAGVGEILLAGLASAGAVAAVAFPVGLHADRFFNRVRRSLDAGETVEPSSAPSYARPFAIALEDWRAKVKQEADKAAGKLREMEIRRRVGEAELRQIEATLDSLRDAVLVTDQFDELKRANEAAARLLGFDIDPSLHRAIDQVVRDETLVRLIRSAREGCSLTDRKRVEYEMNIGGEGRRRSMDITLACLPDPTGEGVAGVVTILRDVTREKEISQMKSDFVSQVSHELRTPLSSINAYVEMLVDGEAKDENARREFYEVIKNEADRLGRLIDNMLNISRIEAGIIQVERVEVDFVQVVREVVEVMQPQAKLKDITLINKAGPLVYTAQADRDMMHQVVLNLVSNAVKYTPEGGRVTITVENDDPSRSVMISVADTGLGIPPDALDKVFDKFYRIDNYKRVAKGTGLGLNLVKHIIETVHGGQVGVQSKVGMGSRFWFTVPFEQALRAAA